jgi:hypothetical protein
MVQPLGQAVRRRDTPGDGRRLDEQMRRTDRGRSREDQAGTPDHRRERLDGLVAPASAADHMLLAAAVGNRAFSAAVARLPAGSDGAARGGRRAPLVPGAPSLQRAVLARRKPDVVFADETVHGDVWFDKVENRMIDVQSRLTANGASYGVLLMQAGEAFEKLAADRLELIAGEITGEQFAEALVGAALTVAMGQVAGRIANAALKTLVAPGTSRIREQIKQETKAGLSNADDIDALRHAVVEIKLNLLKAGARMTGQAQAWLPLQLTPIYAKCRAGEELDAAESELVAPFMELPAERIDTEIERMFGIPSPESSKVVMVEVFRALVEEFARIELRTTTKGVRESVEMGFGTGPQTLAGRAREAAKAAAGVESETLGVTWEDFARAGRSYAEARACGVPLPELDEYESARRAEPAR